jgi:hypothetical protein
LFKHVKKHSTAFKFWLIAASPFLFFIYNNLRKNKKLQRRKDDFYLNVAVYTIFSAVALVFVIYIFSQNALIAQGFDNVRGMSAKSAKTSVSVQQPIK